MALPGQPARQLARLLPELREGLSAAARRLQELGEVPGAVTVLQEELQRLYGAFLLSGTRELVHLGSELLDAACALEGALEAEAREPGQAQPLRAAIMDAVLRLPRAVERLAVYGADIVPEAASLIDGLRRAHGRPRYDGLALLRQCLDPDAPRGCEEVLEQAPRERWAYQKGLIELIRGETPSGLAKLRSVLEPLERALGDSAAGGAAWGALAVLDALEASEALEDRHKRAVAAYERELRRLAEEGASASRPEPNVIDALLQPLTYVAGTGRVGRVQAAYARLPDTALVMPAAAAGSALAPMVPAPASQEEEHARATFYAEVGLALSQVELALDGWRSGDPEAGVTAQRILHRLGRGAWFAGLMDFRSHIEELEQQSAIALAEGLGSAAEMRLRHGLEQLAESAGVLRSDKPGEVGHSVGRSAEPLKREGGLEGKEACEGPEGVELLEGPGQAILEEAVDAELAEDGSRPGGIRCQEGAPEEYPGRGDDAAAAAPHASASGAWTLRDLVPALERVLHGTAEATAKQAVLAIEGDGLALPEADPETLQSVLEHLVDNAVRHGVEPPGVRTEQGKDAVGHVEVRLRHAEAEAWLSVRDDGAGLDGTALQRLVSDDDPVEATGALSDDEALSLICLPGVSTRNDPEAGEAGSMDMEQVASWVHALGGTLQLQARPGLGTRLTLHLPMSEAQAATRDTEVEAGARVLIFNPSRTLRRIAAQQLGRAGYVGVGAGTLEEARAAAAQWSPQAVLLDLEMQADGEGVAGLPQLVEAVGVPSAALVAVSTRAGDQRRLVEMGLEDTLLLLKPYDERQLADAVAQACRSGGDGLAGGPMPPRDVASASPESHSEPP